MTKQERYKLGWNCATLADMDYTALRNRVLQLANEVRCRVEHCAESGGNLEYVEKQLKAILEAFR